MQLTGAIMAGGQSRRMGRDKTALEIGGRTLLEHTALIVQEAMLSVLVVGRERPDHWSLQEVVFLPDDSPGCGPLGGLHTALRHVGGPVLALPCDLPLLTADAMRWLIAQASGPIGEHGLVIVQGGHWEPLFSVYASACLPQIETNLATGRLSLHGLIENGDFTRMAAPDWVAAQLVNVNTQEEWEQLLR